MSDEKLFPSQVKGRENGFKEEDLTPGGAGNMDGKPRRPVLNALKFLKLIQEGLVPVQLSLGLSSPRAVRVSMAAA